jgi:hypothetical protein
MGYWTGDSIHQGLYAALMELVPVQGEAAGVGQQKLNKFIAANRVYYDIFNNGGFNRGRSVFPTFGVRLSDYRFTTIGHLPNGRSYNYKELRFDRIEEALEEPFTKILLEAAAEQLGRYSKLIGEPRKTSFEPAPAPDYTDYSRENLQHAGM